MNYRYKLRSECFQDIANLLYKHGLDIQFYVIEASNVEPDCTFEFQSKETLAVWLYRLNDMVDCHVMLETIQYIEGYTGNRVKRDLSIIQ